MLTNVWFWVSVVLLLLVVLLIFLLNKKSSKLGDLNVVYGYDGEGWDPRKPLIYLATADNVESLKDGDLVQMVVRIKNTL